LAGFGETRIKATVLGKVGEGRACCKDWRNFFAQEELPDSHDLAGSERAEVKEFGRAAGEAATFLERPGASCRRTLLPAPPLASRPLSTESGLGFRRLVVVTKRCY
jgi:hypothetical protein